METALPDLFNASPCDEEGCDDYPHEESEADRREDRHEEKLQDMDADAWYDRSRDQEEETCPF